MAVAQDVLVDIELISRAAIRKSDIWKRHPNAEKRSEDLRKFRFLKRAAWVAVLILAVVFVRILFSAPEFELPRTMILTLAIGAGIWCILWCREKIPACEEKLREIDEEFANLACVLYVDQRELTRKAFGEVRRCGIAILTESLAVAESFRVQKDAQSLETVSRSLDRLKGELLLFNLLTTEDLDQTTCKVIGHLPRAKVLRFPGARRSA